MSIQSDITTALSAVAGGRVYPQIAPQDAITPFVTYRIPSAEPLMTLQGYEGITKFIVEFACIAKTYAETLSTAASVQSALDISFPGSNREPPPENRYVPESDEYAEFLTVSIWHT